MDSARADRNNTLFATSSCSIIFEDYESYLGIGILAILPDWVWVARPLKLIVSPSFDQPFFFEVEPAQQAMATYHRSETAHAKALWLGRGWTRSLGAWQWYHHFLLWQCVWCHQWIPLAHYCTVLSRKVGCGLELCFTRMWYVLCSKQ